MTPSIIKNLMAGSYSLLLHAVLLILLIYGLETTSTPRQLASEEQVEIVQATVLDETLIEQEMARLDELDLKAREEEEARQQALEDKLKQTQDELARQEQEYLDMQERAELEQQQREVEAEAEKQRIAEL
jgi:colicin import membrane protein